MNKGYSYRSTVRCDEAGRSVLEHHVLRYPHSDAAAWRENVEAGRVLVNGEVAACALVLREGDRLEYRRPAWTEPDAPTTVRIVFEDDEVLAVDKPAGLQVLPAGRFLLKTLLGIVRAQDPAREEWTPVHRLGRGTSGLVLFGKTAHARASLSAQFRERRVSKLYLGVVAPSGWPTSFDARHPIGRVEHAGAHVHSVAAGGKPSLTRVRVLRRDHAAGTALVAAVPVTGRPDQIRIHLAACGAPLVGDPLYGPGATLLAGARAGHVGYLLHAVRLRVRHPTSGGWLRLRCPPPWSFPT